MSSAANLAAIVGATPPAPTNILADQNLMGYHLLADVYHDFPQFDKTSGKYYNIGGKDAAGRYGGKTGENDVVKYFLETDKDISEKLSARKQGRLHFALPEKTASFSEWKAPVLFLGGNNNVGIVQDAGHFITPQLKCQNVITFGSILDPAGKPIAPEQNPIWYDPGTTTGVDIPLNIFGFDPSVITTLGIRNLIPGSVSAIFENVTIDGKQVNLDAINMNVAGTTLSTKPINNTKPSFAGFFTSPKKIEDIARIITEESGKSNIPEIIAKYKHLFYVAKTLGDTSLVASAMPSFGGVPNPYYGVSATTGWKQWATTEYPFTRPSTLALKTGDRLNWLRAILFNVPAIYETGGKMRSYKYFPGIASETDIRNAIVQDLNEIPGRIHKKYQDLRNSLNELTTNFRSNFAPGGADEITPTNTNGINHAIQLINEVINALYNDTDATLITPDTKSLFPMTLPTGTPSICARVLQWVNTRINAIINNKIDNTILKQHYMITLERANACSPQTTDILIQKRRTEDSYLSSKLIVANVPPGASYPEWPNLQYLDISLRNAFRKLNRSADYNITDTDINNRFFLRLSGPSSATSSASGQSGGDGAKDTISTTVNEVVGSYDPGPLYSKFSRLPKNLEFINLENYFYIHRFQKYVNEIEGLELSNQRILEYINEIYKFRNTKRILDDVVLMNLVSAFTNFCREYKIGHDTFVASTEQSSYSTRPIVLFNAYTYRINTQNARSLTNNDFDNEDGFDTEASQDFQRYEQKFLDFLSVPFILDVIVKPGSKVIKRADIKEMEKRKTQKGVPIGLLVGKTPTKGHLAEITGEERTGVVSTLPPYDMDELDGGRRHTFRRKRPTSKKNVESTGSGSTRNARLRKQPRTRTTYRVRKHTGKSKTRRQRHNLDRV